MLDVSKKRRDDIKVQDGRFVKTVVYFERQQLQRTIVVGEIVAAGQNLRGRFPAGQGDR